MLWILCVSWEAWIYSWQMTPRSVFGASHYWTSECFHLFSVMKTSCCQPQWAHRCGWVVGRDMLLSLCWCCFLCFYSILKIQLTYLLFSFLFKDVVSAMCRLLLRTFWCHLVIWRYVVRTCLGCLCNSKNLMLLSIMHQWWRRILHFQIGLAIWITSQKRKMMIRLVLRR